MGCALVALVAPSGQLRRARPLVQELSRYGALRGCPKVFLLLSSGCGGECLGRDLGWGTGGAGDGQESSPRWPTRSSCAVPPPAAAEPGVFLTGLRELCGRSPHWSLLRLLTEVEASEGEWGDSGPVVPWPSCALLS